MAPPAVAVPDWVLTRAAPVAAVVVLFSPRLVLIACLVLAGFLAGVVLGGGISLSLEDQAAVRSDMDLIEEKLAKIELVSLESARKDETDERPLPPVPQKIESSLNRLISLIIRDFILSWYSAINYSKSDEFATSIDSALHHGLITFGFAASKTKVVNAVSPITQTLIRHIYEYRDFEASSLPLEVYLERNPQSSFHKYADSRESNKFLRRISAHIVMSIMPKADRESPVVFSLLREIVGTSVLGNLVETYSDPDYINKLLIGYVKEQEKLAAAQATADSSSGTSDVLRPISIPKPVKSTVRSINGDQLFLKVVEAKQLPLGQGSVFCRVIFNGNELKTERIAAETHPIWMEEFAFDWGAMLPTETILIEVYDGRLIRDELIGSVYIPAKSLQANVYSKEWYPIDTSESKIANTAFMAQIFVETLVISISNLDESRPEGLASENIRSTEIPLSLGQTDCKLPEIDEFESAETLLSDSREGINISSKSGITITIPLVEALSCGEYRSSFSKYLEPIEASAYLHLYTTITSLPDTITADQARGVFDIFFNSSKLDPKVEGSVMTALNSASFDDMPNKTARIGSELFDPVENATLTVLESHWAAFVTTDGFKSIEGVTEAPVKPPRSLSAAPPPLPPRDTVSKSPPPLPPRESEMIEAQRTEEEDIQLAIVLQEEEFRLIKEPKERTSSLSVDTVARKLLNSENSPDSDFSAATTIMPSNISILGEISALKEKIAYIDHKLEITTSVAVGQELLSDKLDLQAQVERLSETLRDSETESSPSVNLFSASIRISDVSDDAILNERINIADRLLFCIEVQPKSNVSGWVLTKTLTDFSSCYDALAAEFIHIKRGSFPGLFFRNNNITSCQAHERSAVASDLELWLKDILNNTNTSQAFAVLDLLQPEHMKHKSSLGKKSTTKRSDTVSGTVFGVLKSAGSVLKNVAVSTGNAINTIGSNNAVEPSKTGNWEAKLQQRRDAGVKSNVPSRTSSLAGKSSLPKSVPQTGGTYSSLATDPHSEDEAAAEVKPAANAIQEISAPALPHRATATTPSKGDTVLTPKPSIIRSKSPTPGPKSEPPPSTPKASAELSPSELAILLECAFGVIEEVFNLSDPNQWMRQRGLQVVKSVLRNSYGVTISTMIQEHVDDIRSVDAVSGYLDAVSDSLWPNGVWAYSTPEYLVQLEADKLNPRTDSQRSETRMEAKRLLNSNAVLLGYEGIQTVLGKQNTTMGLSRLFNMLQHKELNKGLICAILEAVVRSVLAEH
ncbi:PXA domain-containing protein [Obelidium mucronatum]|nr:PXA domain-containing protein [Obelidium mucronatum]